MISREKFPNIDASERGGTTRHSICIQTSVQLKMTFLAIKNKSHAAGLSSGALLSSLILSLALVGEVCAQNGDGRPGTFRLLLSNNNRLCKAVEGLLNSRDQQKKRTELAPTLRFAEWESARNVDRGDFDGGLVETRIDLNNDGVVDRVIRISASLGGVLSDSLHIVDPTYEGSSIPLRTVFSMPGISFIEAAEHISRLERRYGTKWQKWFFTGVASIDAFTYLEKTHVIAKNINVPYVSAEAYVFQPRVTGETLDVCMFTRIFPCGGCRDPGGPPSPASSLPSSKWCTRK